MSYDRASINTIYLGSDADATRRLYADLQARGPAGEIAMNLFRAQKASARAKVYRGGERGRGSYRSMAYDKKNWSMDCVCVILNQHADGLGLRWGWKIDTGQEAHRYVLYVDLPTGQVSFHAGARGAGPDYPGDFDGAIGHSPGRILAYVATLFEKAIA